MIKINNMFIFLIPVDLTRHSRFVKNIEALKTEGVSDVIVILTRKSDLKLWNDLNNKCEALVLEDWVSDEAIRAAEERQSMPTFKKWCALWRIQDRVQYSHIVCCDSEINVLKPIDKFFADSLPSQLLFAGDHMPQHPGYDGYRKLVQLCREKGEVSPTIDSGCGKRIYTWWSGLPVYVTGSTLREFLEHVGMTNPLALAQSLTREIFDHIVYQHYLTSRRLHGARFLCFTHECRISFGWSLEDTAPEAAFSAAEKAGLVTLWMAKRTRLRLPERNTVYLEYHLDHAGD